MDTEQLRQDIFDSLNATWGTATVISWPNKDFEPPLRDVWIRPGIFIPVTTVGEIGQGGVGLRDGILFISVFVPQGDGQRVGNLYADRLEAAFRRADIGDIWFDEPNATPHGVDPNGYFHISVTIPFHCWIGE